MNFCIRLNIMPTSGSKEPQSDSVPEFARDVWMVRPCELYKEEYRDCQSFRGRFHQLFTTGVKKDCSEWKEDFINCLEWGKNLTFPALEKILRNENRRIANRISNVLENDVWTLHNTPRKDWNDPLPEHLQKLNEGMTFKTKPSSSQAQSTS